MARDAEVVDEHNGHDAGDERDAPANKTPEENDVEMEIVVGVGDHPLLDEVAEGEEGSGGGHGNHGSRHEEDGGGALLPESPDAARDAIGAAETFHEGKQDAHGGEPRMIRIVIVDSTNSAFAV